MRWHQQQATEWLLPFRSLPPPPLLVIPVEPDVNVRYYPGFRDHKVMEWQTCNRVWRENIDFGTHTLPPNMQQFELEKLNLTKLGKVGFPGNEPFFYPSWDTLPKEEEYALGIYGNREPVMKKFSPRQIVVPNHTSLIFKHQPTDRKVYRLGGSVWKSREVTSFEMSFYTLLDLQ